MSDVKLTDQEAQNFRTVYQELCNSYRAIDEFRTKLLGLLPLATGTGIFILIMDKKKFEAVEEYLPYIGLFGFFVTLGLLFYELYGIKKCTSLIKEGIRLEEKIGEQYGQFTKRPFGVLGLINEPTAASMIYPAVLASWVFIGILDFNIGCAELIAMGVFAIGFITVFGYTLFLIWDDIKKYWKKDFVIKPKQNA